MDGLAKELMPAPYAQPPRQCVFPTWNQTATGTGRLSTSCLVYTSDAADD